MKRIALAVLLLIALGAGYSSSEAMQRIEAKSYDIMMKRDILCLMSSYPGYITGIKKNEKGGVYILLKSGKNIIYDDKAHKSIEQKLENPDIQDMMEQLYPLESIKDLMPEKYDPGRIRVYKLFNEVYGNSKNKVESELVRVRTGNGAAQFNKNNGAAKALEEAMLEASKAAAAKKSIYGSLYPISGTFNYRLIAGTGRLSPHAYGIAIDLARDKRDYWKWASRSEGQKRFSIYPEEIVRAFENNNFIWGGKWGHFDILHFEYRPEIIMKSRYSGIDITADDPWYKGFPQEDDSIKKYIDIIDKVFE